MNTKLDKLKKLIEEITSRKERPDVMDSLVAEAEELPDKITAGIFGLGTDYQIRQYVCWHMHRLVKLANSLYRHGQRHPRFALKRATLCRYALSIMTPIIAKSCSRGRFCHQWGVVF